MVVGGSKIHERLAHFFIDIYRICDAAIYLPDEELRSLSWSSFVSGITELELIQYLKERDLYINEPTEGEVEF